MAENMGEWPYKRGPVLKIRPLDGCGGDAVLLAVERWYDFHEFGWHLGNVGLELKPFTRHVFHDGRVATPCREPFLVISMGETFEQRIEERRDR